jgi:hypothetical protein
MAYVVALSPSFDQLLCYHVPETKQDATRCALGQHRSSDECGAIKRKASFTWDPSGSGAITHLYARSREAMVLAGVGGCSKR